MKQESQEFKGRVICVLTKIDMNKLKQKIKQTHVLKYIVLCLAWVYEISLSYTLVSVRFLLSQDRVFFLFMLFYNLL